MADRKETAADIHISVGNRNDIVVERLTLTKNIDIEQVRGSGRVYPDGYGITAIDYQGTMELEGDKLDLEEHLFDDNGIPVEATITVTHLDGGNTTFTEVLATSEGWEMNSEEVTTTSFEFVAMGKSHDGRVDTQP